ncbi:uncharacterized protein LOC111345622 [Stylophora pistillata]|uniref:uncharacterized protein LOC111345622 n=1 Tax=Stylophora pistillata TaxID=50429 RepID=UPI000C057171|nr:uncharacterized protein LOC111345622 [Stylophora pistillata]
MGRSIADAQKPEHRGATQTGSSNKRYKFLLVSKSDLTAIRFKKLDLDAALKTWEKPIKQAVNVLSEFDQEIKAFKENHKATWTYPLTFLGLAGGATAIGLGVGGILAAGLSIGCGATGAYMALLCGGAVSVTGVCLVLKRWFTVKINLCDKLLSIRRNYHVLLRKATKLLIVMDWRRPIDCFSCVTS